MLAVDIFHHTPSIHGVQNAQIKKKEKKVICNVITSVLVLYYPVVTQGGCRVDPSGESSQNTQRMHVWLRIKRL